ncbi:MAG: hypothetical protein RLZZ21_1364 [Planctomycetota bacterium]
MISSAPVAAATSLDSGLLSKVHAFVETAKSSAADGLTWVEFGDLMLALLRLVVSALDSVKSMTGAEKKAFALEAVGSLFDAVADYAVPVSVYPIWLIARPAVRVLVLAIASGSLEQVLPLVRVA